MLKEEMKEEFISHTRISHTLIGHTLISHMAINYMQKSLTNKETNSAIIKNKNIVEVGQEIEVQNVIYTEDKNTETTKATRSTSLATEQKTTSPEAMHIHPDLLRGSNVVVNSVGNLVGNLVVKCVDTLLCK